MEKSTIATNRKAYHEFHILETYEAGMELKGSEVKSIREGKASLKEAYVGVRGGEIWLKGAHIAAYSHTGFDGHEPTRDRRLLMHKRRLRGLDLNWRRKGSQLYLQSYILKKAG